MAKHREESNRKSNRENISLYLKRENIEWFDRVCGDIARSLNEDPEKWGRSRTLDYLFDWMRIAMDLKAMQGIGSILEKVGSVYFDSQPKRASKKKVSEHE
jgi:hypothetical protein